MPIRLCGRRWWREGGMSNGNHPTDDHHGRSRSDGAAGDLRILQQRNKRYLKILAQEEDVKQIKTEQTLIVYALFACLDGLEQLGANHTVPVAKDKLNKYINQLAHDQLDK